MVSLNIPTAGRPLIDLDSPRSWANNRSRGYIADIGEDTSDNTDTPNRLTVVGGVWFTDATATPRPTGYIKHYGRNMGLGLYGLHL